MKTYTFECELGIDNGYGNHWSSSSVEVDEYGRVVGIFTEFLGNNAVPEGKAFHTPRDLTYKQLVRLNQCVRVFFAGFEEGRKQ